MKRQVPAGWGKIKRTEKFEGFFASQPTILTCLLKLSLMRTNNYTTSSIPSAVLKPFWKPDPCSTGQRKGFALLNYLQLKLKKQSTHKAKPDMT
jgi:hypothetical protein